MTKLEEAFNVWVDKTEAKNLRFVRRKCITDLMRVTGAKFEYLPIGAALEKYRAGIQKAYSKTSYQRYLSMINNFYAYCGKDRPFKKMYNVKPIVYISKHDVTQEQIDKLFDYELHMYLSKGGFNYLRNYVLHRLAYDLHFTVDIILDLRWSDFSEDLQRYNGKRLTNDLRNWLVDLRTQALSSTFVACKSTGDKLSRNGLDTMLRRYELIKKPSLMDIAMFASAKGE